MKDSFIPVLMGNDINVYSMARAFHQEYESGAISNGALPVRVSVSARPTTPFRFPASTFWLMVLSAPECPSPGWARSR